MEIKKTPEADLEKGRFTFFLIGFAVVLSSFFVFLEWQSHETNNSDWSNLGPVFIEKEFEGGNRTEKSVPNVIPEKSQPEIIFEDFVISDDIPEIEKNEETAISIINPELDETPINQTKSETVTSTETETDSEPVIKAETMPQFPGGQTELIRFIYQNIQYPSVALKQRIEGRVWCSFVVETDGSISNIGLEEGVYIFLDDEAIRVLKLMPAWIPGRTNGENVRVKVYIPIVFKR